MPGAVLFRHQAVDLALFADDVVRADRAQRRVGQHVRALPGTRIVPGDGRGIGEPRQRGLGVLHAGVVQHDEIDRARARVEIGGEGVRI